MEGRFKEWLEDAIVRHGVSRRELARRLASQHPGNGDPESYRRNLGRILAGDVSPTQPTREAIQAALDDFSAPSVDDEAEDAPISRDEFRTWQQVNVKIGRGVPLPNGGH